MIVTKSIKKLFSKSQSIVMYTLLFFHKKIQHTEKWTSNSTAMTNQYKIPAIDILKHCNMTSVCNRHIEWAAKWGPLHRRERRTYCRHEQQQLTELWSHWTKHCHSHKQASSALVHSAPATNSRSLTWGTLLVHNYSKENGNSAPASHNQTDNLNFLARNDNLATFKHGKTAGHFKNAVKKSRRCHRPALYSMQSTFIR